MTRLLTLLFLLTGALLSASGVEHLYSRLGVKVQRSLNPSPIMGYYLPQADRIYLLKENKYESQGDFNHIALHELGHWSRHRMRLGPIEGRFSTPIFVEEVVVDLAAQILTEELAIPGQDDGVVRHYLRSQLHGQSVSPRQWRTIQREVQKTVEYILGRPYGREGVKALFTRLYLPSLD